jgi:hypothetical protein
VLAPVDFPVTHAVPVLHLKISLRSGIKRSARTTPTVAIAIAAPIVMVFRNRKRLNPMPERNMSCSSYKLHCLADG